MVYPEDLKYSKEHEWVRIEGGIVTVGITDFAQEQLGDIVMVEFPPEGEMVEKGGAFGVVESVKSVSDVFAPVSGKIVERNDPVVEATGVLNEDCYGEGWLVKIEMSNPKEVDDLMDARAYKAFLEETA